MAFFASEPSPETVVPLFITPIQPKSIEPTVRKEKAARHERERGKVKTGLEKENFTMYDDKQRVAK